MMNRLGVWVVIAAAAIAAPSAAADKTVAAEDRAFVDGAASVGMMEVELGKIAATHAANAEVKKFGQHMVDDHTKANAELKRLAASKSITLPTSMAAEHRKEVDHLSKLKGADFDHAYMQAMVKGHGEVVEKFRKQAEAAHDADVKAFAARMLPTLESHLEMAKTTSEDTAKATSGARR
jgi:putative membrane protein